jgi:hypothetical protein
VLERRSLQRPDSSGDKSALSESRRFFFNQDAHRFHSSGVAVPSIMRSKNAPGSAEAGLLDLLPLRWEPGTRRHNAQPTSG